MARPCIDASLSVHRACGKRSAPAAGRGAKCGTQGLRNHKLLGISGELVAKAHLRAVVEGETDRRIFRIIDPDTGEHEDHVGGCPECRANDDYIAGLQRDVKAEHLRYENLKRDKDGCT